MEYFQFLLYTSSMPNELFGSGNDWKVRNYPEKLDHLVKNAYDQDSYFPEKMLLRTSVSMKTTICTTLIQIYTT